MSALIPPNRDPPHIYAVPPTHNPNPSGEITITEEGGTVSRFEAGDVFFVPAGTVCSWHAPSYVKKYYAVLVPPAT